MFVLLNKPTLFLFSDISVDPKTGVGYGAYLLLSEYELEAPISKLKIKIKKFENTTSSKLELESLLWAISEIPITDSKIIIYTDCQNIINLKDREERLKNSGYLNKNGVFLKNHELYKKFYQLQDLYDCDFIKVKGHKKPQDKDMADRYFTLVDKASREALREKN
jgi:ribonuclease HI